MRSFATACEGIPSPIKPSSSLGAEGGGSMGAPPPRERAAPFSPERALLELAASPTHPSHHSIASPRSCAARRALVPPLSAGAACPGSATVIGRRGGAASAGGLSAGGLFKFTSPCGSRSLRPTRGSPTSKVLLLSKLATPGAKTTSPEASPDKPAKGGTAGSAKKGSRAEKAAAAAAASAAPIVVVPSQHASPSQLSPGKSSPHESPTASADSAAEAASPKPVPSPPPTIAQQLSAINARINDRARIGAAAATARASKQRPRQLNNYSPVPDMADCGADELSLGGSRPPSRGPKGGNPKGGNPKQPRGKAREPPPLGMGFGRATKPPVGVFDNDGSILSSRPIDEAQLSELLAWEMNESDDPLALLYLEPGAIEGKGGGLGGGLGGGAPSFAAGGPGGSGSLAASADASGVGYRMSGAPGVNGHCGLSDLAGMSAVMCDEPSMEEEEDGALEAGALDAGALEEPLVMEEPLATEADFLQ